jgi:restriction system protein
MAGALIAVEQVLTQAGEPLHYKEITRRILEGRLWETDGKTPESTVNAQLVVHIKKHGKNGKFRRVGPGVFTLNRRG